MAISSNKKQGMFNDINITPLTDIFLVLLIIMMVIAPTFQNIDKTIKIPEINSGLSVEEKNVVVSLAENGALYINKSKVDFANLSSELSKLLGKSKEKAVVLQADQKAKSKDVIAIMQAAQVAGFEKLTIAGEPLSKVKQRELNDINSKDLNN